MNITITTSVPKVAQQITLSSIVNKLNVIVKTSDFFVECGNSILFKGCCNFDSHNRIIVILMLYIDSLHGKYGCYSWLHGRDGFVGEFALKTLPLNELNDFIDGIGEIEKTTVNINL